VILPTSAARSDLQSECFTNLKFDTNTTISVTQIIVELQDILQALGLQIRASAFKAKTIAIALFFVYPNFISSRWWWITSLRSVILGGEIQSKNHR
jgi:hypothetical protein